MSTIQLIGIGIAVVILILLIIALIVTRRRDRARDQSATPPPRPVLPTQPASVLEGPPRDDLDRLGGNHPSAQVAPAIIPAAEHDIPHEAARPDISEGGPRETTPDEATPASTTHEAEIWGGGAVLTDAHRHDLGLWDRPQEEAHEEPAASTTEETLPPQEQSELTVGTGAAPARDTLIWTPTSGIADTSAAAGPDVVPAPEVLEEPVVRQEPPPPAVERPVAQDQPETESARAAAHQGSPAPRADAARPASSSPAAADTTAAGPAAVRQPPVRKREPRLVRLCDIIGTTNTQLIDLNDPEVRRMLRELVQNEVDLAQQYKQLGQNVDAVLQLTEAQKICQALSMESHAKLLERMIRQLQV